MPMATLLLTLQLLFKHYHAQSEPFEQEVTFLDLLSQILLCTLEHCVTLIEPLEQNVTLVYESASQLLCLARPGFKLTSLLLTEPPCCCLLQPLLQRLATRDGGTAHKHRTADGRYGGGGVAEVLEAHASKPGEGCCCYGAGCAMQLRLLRGHQRL